MLLMIGFILAPITVLLIHYATDDRKALVRLSLVLVGLTTVFMMFGIIQFSLCAWEDENRQANIEKRAFYMAALENKNTANELLALGEEISEFNRYVRRANTYNNSPFAPFIKGIVYQPSYVGLEPIPIGEAEP